MSEAFQRFVGEDVGAGFREVETVGRRVTSSPGRPPGTARPEAGPPERPQHWPGRTREDAGRGPPAPGALRLHRAPERGPGGSSARGFVSRENFCSAKVESGFLGPWGNGNMGIWVARDREGKAGCRAHGVCGRTCGQRRKAAARQPLSALSPWLFREDTSPQAGRVSIQM